MKKPDFEYPEINKLNEFCIKYKFISKTDRSKVLDSNEYYPKVNFKLSGEDFYLFIDDEYDDLKKNYPLLNLCLILRELEGYEFADDFKVWCQERYLNALDVDVKNSFEHLKKTYIKIAELVGKIESFISDFDFEMNSGAAQKLRK